MASKSERKGSASPQFGARQNRSLIELDHNGDPTGAGRLTNSYAKLLGLTTLVIFAGALSWLVWNTQVALAARNRANESQSQTLQVLLITQKLLSAYQDTETGQRGYLLTRDQSYLLPYNRGRQLAPVLFSSLTRLTADNPKQAASLSALAKLSALRLSQIDHTVQLGQSARFSEGVTFVENGEGARTMNMVRSLIASILSEEDRLLALRRKAAATATSTSDALTGLLSGICALSFLGAGAASAAMITGRNRLEAKLRQVNSELEEKVHTRTADIESVLANLSREMKKRILAEAEVRKTHLQLIHLARTSAMGTMGTTIAHELNQPLAAITSYIRGGRRLLESGGSKEAVRNALIAADEATMRAGKVVSGIRELVSNGDFNPCAEVHTKLVREACDLAMLGAASSGVRWRMRLNPAIVDVFIDRIQIQQVLTNLLRNSIEAMSESPRRHIVIANCLSSDNFCQITVRDTGPGVPPTIIPRLFDSFNTSKPDGNGIGLSICRTIVESHGGEIWNRPCRSGALFAFTIPCVK